MIKRILLGLALFMLILVAFIWWRTEGSETMEPSQAVSDKAGQIERGRYLAQAGDCLACHTSRGGTAYAGGRAIATAFGTFRSPNITPDAETGLGKWTADDFWRALHFGKSRDGSLLYPAFPYTNYTKVTRADADAMFAYLQSLAPVHAPQQAHTLAFPYNQRILLRGWQALFFTPGTYQPIVAKGEAWNRGAYLVEGIGHCGACHSSRNALGANDVHTALAGGFIPIQNWYAPALTANGESGLGHWDEQEIATLLKTGTSPRGAVYGPMSEVVYDSLQYLSDADTQAMTHYLKSLPEQGAPPEIESAALPTEQREAMINQGRKLYHNDCEACHKATGNGVGNIYPPLAGNSSVLAQSPVNPIRMVLNGGFPPGTAGNPRPYGMPPFGQAYSDQQVAAVVTYIRQSWGNKAEAVSPIEVAKYRSVPGD